MLEIIFSKKGFIKYKNKLRIIILQMFNKLSRL